MGEKINKSEIIAHLTEVEGFDPEKLDDLLEKLQRNTLAVEQIEGKLSKYLSKRYQVRMGLIRATSTALGATIGIAFVIIFLQWMVQYLGEIPIIDEIIKIIIENIPDSCTP